MGRNKVLDRSLTLIVWVLVPILALVGYLIPEMLADKYWALLMIASTAIFVFLVSMGQVFNFAQKVYFNNFAMKVSKQSKIDESFGAAIWALYFVAFGYAFLGKVFYIVFSVPSG